MGKPVTLLEKMCEHLLSFGGEGMEVEHKDGYLWAFTRLEGKRDRIAKWPGSGNNAEELCDDLYATAKKPVRTVIHGVVLDIKVCVSQDSGDPGFTVTIEPAPKLDPSVKPAFTAKQGQYLAYIYNYTKIHRVAPAEGDLERYFRVSPPSIHDMIKTLERNGLIERTPGQARSIRLMVKPEFLPRLE